MRLISDGDHRAVRSDSEARRDRHPQDSMIQTDTFLWRPRSASVSLSLTFSNRSVSLSPSLSVRLFVWRLVPVSGWIYGGVTALWWP